MELQLGNVVFVVWRECVEALLVVGILSAWLAKQEPKQGVARGRLYLWSGVGAGLLLAVALAAAFAKLDQSAAADTQQYVHTAMELVAAALIVQMVLWMRKHGRTLKREMETSLSAASERSDWWTVFLLAALAVAREGSEAVVFLFGTWSAVHQSAPGMFALAVLLGAAAAFITYAALQLGVRVLSWRLFFGITEVMLLCLAGALLVSAVENLVALEVLPELSGRLWDSSRLLPDSGRVGGLLASLTGYRARPHLTELLTLALYWGMISWLLLGLRQGTRPA